MLFFVCKSMSACLAFARCSLVASMSASEIAPTDVEGTARVKSCAVPFESLQSNKNNKRPTMKQRRAHGNFKSTAIYSAGSPSTAGQLHHLLSSFRNQLLARRRRVRKRLDVTHFDRVYVAVSAPSRQLAAELHRRVGPLFDSNRQVKSRPDNVRR